MEYEFYFDETCHDRSIKFNKTGVLNTMVEFALDSYIGVFWGCEESRLNDITQRLSQFENKFKSIFQLQEDQELKSQLFTRPNYTYGIKSFKKNTYAFYYDLFSLIKETHPIFQIEIISKIEHIIRKILSEAILPRNMGINLKAVIYSLTKFIYVYHTEELLSNLFNMHSAKDSYNLKKVLLKHLKYVTSNIKDIPRKKTEYHSLNQLTQIIKSTTFFCTSSDKYEFSYIPNFNGLSLLLEEMDIPNSNVSISMDREEKTYQTGLQFGFKKITQVESDQNIQVRFSDWISGFIARMIYAIQNDQNMLEDKIERIEDIGNNDLSTKRILSKEWFELDEKQFELYILINNSFIIGHDYYWTTMTTVNCDQAILFFSLIRYFASYESFESYNSINSELHSEHYNSQLLNELKIQFKKMEY